MKVTKGESKLKTWLKNIQIETGYIFKGDFISGTETKNVDILIDGKRIEKVRPHSNDFNGLNVQDGKGYLIIPAIREMHCHFDKSKLGLPWQHLSPARSIVERFETEIPQLEKSPLSLSERMHHLVEAELSHGVTFFRSHIDVHPKVGQKYLQETLSTLQEYHGRFNYELVAFPQHGLIRSNAYQDMKVALENGANLVGGVDPNALDGNVVKSLQQTFELATTHNANIDLHLHERGSQGKQTFYEILKQTKVNHWQGKVTISHAFGLNDFLDQERQEFFQQLAENDISIFSSVPLNGSIPPLKELRQAGVQIALDCDNVYDSWSPFGNGNVLEKLNRYNEIFRITSQKALTDSLTLVTGQNTVSSNGLWLKKDMEANFTLVDSSCSAEFVARQLPVKATYYQGKLFKIND